MIHYRKNILLLAMAAMLSVAPAMMPQTSVYATKMENTEELTEEITEESSEDDTDEDGYVAPIVYGEMENGLFVRTTTEELATIEGGLDNPYYWQERKKIFDARRLGYLTDEMVADGGYLLVGDLVVMVEDLEATMEEGEAGEGAATEQDDITENYGFVTITAQVEDAISESETACFVGLSNTETGEYVEFSLYAVNDYTSTGKLPAGTWYILQGGIAEDYTGECALEDLTGTFAIQAGGSAQVSVAIGDVDGSREEARVAEEEGKAEKEAQEEAERLAEEERLADKKAAKQRQRAMVAAGISVVVLTGAVIGIVAVIRKKKMMDEWR